MIDPTKFPRYDLNANELEEVALFSILVAGKNALTTARALDKLLGLYGCWIPNAVSYGLTINSPYKALTYDGTQDKLANNMKYAGIGCSKLKGRAIWDLIHSNTNLYSCSVAELEAIHGIGPKTARFFILHTRRNAEVACLDTHILTYIREQLCIDTPKSTPTGSKYLNLEQIFLDHAKARGMTPAELDIQIWNTYSGSVAKLHGISR